jgi:hypothetical protein
MNKKPAGRWYFSHEVESLFQCKINPLLRLSVALRLAPRVWSWIASLSGNGTPIDGPVFQRKSHFLWSGYLVG